jgi:hypothetical protein
MPYRPRLRRTSFHLICFCSSLAVAFHFHRFFSITSTVLYLHNTWLAQLNVRARAAYIRSLPQPRQSNNRPNTFRKTNHPQKSKMLFSRSVIVSALMGFAAAQSRIASAQSSLSTGSVAAGGNTPAGMAPTHVIQVGGPNGSLVFSPNNVQAKAGDLIQFQFHAKVREHGSSGGS